MCDSCEALMINGIHCHEFGCPAAKRVQDEEWYNDAFETEEFESEEVKDYE